MHPAKKDAQKLLFILVAVGITELASDLRFIEYKYRVSVLCESLASGYYHSNSFS